jgi:hypothetical protein
MIRSPLIPDWPDYSEWNRITLNISRKRADSSETPFKAML